MFPVSLGHQTPGENKELWKQTEAPDTWVFQFLHCPAGGLKVKHGLFSLTTEFGFTFVDLVSSACSIGAGARGCALLLSASLSSEWKHRVPFEVSTRRLFCLQLAFGSLC